MTTERPDINQELFYRQLCWGLNQLANYGESTDPHVENESLSQAVLQLDGLAHEVSGNA
jgi:hypothetical protein